MFLANSSAGADVGVFLLANHALSPDSPYLKRSLVNRVWKQLLGRGLVGSYERELCPRWSVGASPVSGSTIAFTVNKVQALAQFNAYEPFNTTNEFGVKLGVRF